jgi:hypothetical protein
MVSPRSVELKQGAEEPSMEEAKRCELKQLVEIKRTARISQPRQGGERTYSSSKVGTHPLHEAEGLQGGVARA